MRPMPKKVSKLANIAPTFAGNSLAMMVKLEVRKAELPTASMILMTTFKISVFNQLTCQKKWTGFHKQSLDLHF